MSKLIAIDAGHYLKTSGKRCLKSIDPNQTREWVLNSRIADMLQKMLEKYDCSTMRVDDTTGAKEILLEQRAKKANNSKADIYLSIHHNAGVNGGKGGGTVVFYCSTAQKDKEWAQKLYNDVVEQTGLVGNRSSKVAKKSYYVLANTKMSAFLLENGFMDSTTDTPIILTPEHAQKTATGLLNFLVNVLSLEKKNGVKNDFSAPNTVETKTTYTVQKGDTLSGIGKKLGVSWQKIAEENKIENPYVIKVGQILNIP